MKKILFFDGVCIMCNALVDFVLKHDKSHQIKFATLQGKTAQEILPSSYTQKLTTVVFMQDHQLYTQSDAIIKLLVNINKWYYSVYIFKIIPKFIRDHVYKFIAKHRYDLFGKKEQCRLFSLEEKKRILE